MKTYLLLLLLVVGDKVLVGCGKERQAPIPANANVAVSPDGAILVQCRPGEVAVILYLPDGSIQPGCQQ